MNEIHHFITALRLREHVCILLVPVHVYNQNLRMGSSRTSHLTIKLRAIHETYRQCESELPNGMEEKLYTWHFGPALPYSM